MEIRLDSEGDVRSPLIAALSGRRLGLGGGSHGAHPIQALTASWRQLGGVLAELLDQLETLRADEKNVRTKPADIFRGLTYAATELFDVYAQLLVDRLGPFNRTHRKALREYREVAKRLRSPAAHLCNAFKHGGAQVAFVWVVSTIGGLSSARFMVMAYRNGDALVVHPDFHGKGTPTSIGLVKAAFEILHALFRIDLHAAKLIFSIPENTGFTPIPDHKGTLGLGKILTRLMLLKATVLPHEPTFYDGLERDGSLLRLKRCEAERLLDPMHVTTVSSADGFTRKFPFA